MRANYKVWVGGTVSTQKTALTSDRYKFEGFPKPPSVSIICQKDSENSLKAVLLLLMVYHRESTWVKISRGGRNMGGMPECPTEGQGPSGPLPVRTRTH